MSVTKTITRTGENRTIKLTGRANSTFELYIKQGSNYYNFNTESFTTSVNTLKNQTIPANGKYTKDIVIPTVTSDTRYDFFITPVGETKLDIETTTDLKVGTLFQKGTSTLTVTTTDDTTLSIASGLTGGTATTNGTTLSQTGAITEASGNLVYVHTLPTWTPETGGAWTNTRKVTQNVVYGRDTIWHVEDGTNIVTGLSVTGENIIDEITVSAISGNKVTLSAAQNLKAGQELVFTPSQWEFTAILSKAFTSGVTSVTFTNSVTTSRLGIANLTVELDVDDYIDIKPNAFPCPNIVCPANGNVEIDVVRQCINFLGRENDIDANLSSKNFKIHSIPAHATSSAAIRLGDTSTFGTINLDADESMGSAGTGAVTYTAHDLMEAGDTDIFFYKTVDAQSSPQTSSLTQGKVTVTIV